MSYRENLDLRLTNKSFRRYRKTWNPARGVRRMYRYYLKCSFKSYKRTFSLKQEWRRRHGYGR